jgi:hypothetical protein
MGAYPRPVVKVILALVPSAGILFIFWRVLKALVEADRRERVAEAKWNREHGIAPAGDRGATADGEIPASAPASPSGTTGTPSGTGSPTVGPDDSRA